MHYFLSCYVSNVHCVILNGVTLTVYFVKTDIYYNTVCIHVICV